MYARSHEGVFIPCERCGYTTMESLETYCHCPNCLYSPDFEEPKATPLVQAVKLAQEVSEEEPEEAAEPEKKGTLRQFAGWIGRQIEQGQRISDQVEKQKERHRERLERRALGL
jgi:hypothetical protein